MNSKANGGLRSGKAAVKTVKGFTLIEMLIVIAIIGILSGITSLVIMGFVRDAHIESVNSKAQQAYATIQNLLVETEIKGNENYFNEDYVKGTNPGTFPEIVSLEFYIETGKLDLTTLKLGSGPSSTTVVKYHDYVGGAAVGVTNGEKAMNFFKKYIEDTISAEFTGHVYACIDIQNYLVESVMFTETEDLCIEIVKGTDAYADKYVKTSYPKKIIYGTGSVLAQKADYKMKGDYVGYYPFMNDMGYTLSDDVTPKNNTP